jgi:hypothetical protein
MPGVAHRFGTVDVGAQQPSRRVSGKALVVTGSIDGMSLDGNDQRRWWIVIGLPVAAVIVATAIGLVTEAAGNLVPPVDGREEETWAILGVLVVLAIVVTIATDRSRRRRRIRPGRRVGQFTAAQLEVHNAVAVAGQPTAEQPVYVRRAHDERLAEAVREAIGGQSCMITLVGDSSTGKTRALHEAARTLPRRWRLWHPIDPSRPEAVLASLADVRPHTVVWINDAHHYLATPNPETGERVAAGLRVLLGDLERAPVLVLATAWPQFWRRLTAAPADGQSDLHPQARALLIGTEVPVPTAFTGPDLAAVRAAGRRDQRLAMAVKCAEGGRVAQYLAGVPELLRRYRTATPGARAVLEAAVDARRLGHPVHLPACLLRRAAPGYLSEVDGIALEGQHSQAWSDTVIDELCQPQLGIPGPLIRIGSCEEDTLRLADAIEQAGTTTRANLFPPSRFWDAIAATTTDPDLLLAFGQQAERRGRYRRAAQMYRLAAGRGGTKAMLRLARLHQQAGNHAGAEQLAREAADRGDTQALGQLAEFRDRTGDRAGAEQLAREAANRSDTQALRELARFRDKAGDPAGAEQLYREAANRSDTKALRELARFRDKAGDPAGAEQLYREAADRGDTQAPKELTLLRMKAGDHIGAERLAYEFADRGDTDVLHMVATIWTPAVPNLAKQMLRDAADRGHTEAHWDLAYLRQSIYNRAGAERLARAAADHGITTLLCRLAKIWHETDRAGAGRLAQEAADRGDTDGLQDLAANCQVAGDGADAERLARAAANCGDTHALWRVARIRRRAGDHAGAQELFLEAVDRGNTAALRELADLRKQGGDHAGAERTIRFGLTDEGIPAESLD